MGRLGSRWMIGSVWLATLACSSPARSPTATDIPVEEIEDPVAPPGPRVVTAKGQRRSDADPHELRAAGDYYYRTGEFGRAHSFYMDCFAAADGQLRAACLWAVGATIVVRARGQVADDLAHERELGLPPRPGYPLRECSPAYFELAGALDKLRLAYRFHSTARRALVLGALYEELDIDGEALHFYEQALTLAPDDPTPARAVARLRAREPSAPGRHSNCRPQDCPDLPFDWHRRTGEIEVLGSGLEGIARSRALACFGDPYSFSGNIWSYSRGRCRQLSGPGEPSSSQHVATTVRLHFDGDVLDRVTHERIIEDRDRDCALQTTY